MINMVANEKLNFLYNSIDLDLYKNTLTGSINLGRIIDTRCKYGKDIQLQLDTGKLITVNEDNCLDYFAD